MLLNLFISTTVICIFIICYLLWRRKKNSPKKLGSNIVEWLTIEQHIKKSFTSDIGKKLLKYIPVEKLSTRVETPTQVVTFGFRWKETEEGYKFWDNIKNSINEN